MANSEFKPRRSWSTKFANAFRGVVAGVRGQNSFVVHLPVAAAVLGLAVFRQLSVERWCILLLCIGVVLTAELFNSCIESLARAVDTTHNPAIGKALDIASGAVLVASCTAAVVGTIVFAAALQ